MVCGLIGGLLAYGGLFLFEKPGDGGVHSRFLPKVSLLGHRNL